MGEGSRAPTPAEEPLTVDGCQGRESVFFKSMWPLTGQPWMVPRPYVYAQHKWVVKIIKKKDMNFGGSIRDEEWSWEK